MSEDGISRRELMRAGAGAAGFATLGSLAGCSDDSGANGNGNGDGGPPGSNQIPAESQALIQVDAQGVLNDQNVRDVVNKFLEEAAAQGSYDGPGTTEEILSEAESESDLDPQGFNSMTMFMQVDSPTAAEDYLGMLMDTDWTAEELIEAADGLDEDVEEGSYQGVTTYTSTTEEDSMAADLGDGLFALGTRNAVEDAIDVSTDNGDAISGDLASHFDETSGDYLRFASMIPEEQLPDPQESEFNLQGIQQLRYTSGSLYSQASNLGMDVNMHFTDEQSATDMSDQIDSLLTVAAGQIEDPTAEELVETLEISAEGQTMTMEYEESVSKINSYIEQYAAALFGPAMGGGGFASTSVSASA